VRRYDNGRQHTESSRLATACGFAVGGALRAFFMVAEANRTKRRATSN